jgi:hypothetical protein
MAATNPFVSTGRWYRACLHAHTTNSDGQVSMEALARHYQTAGFDALAITDHWHITDATKESSDEFVVLRGIEYNARGPGVGRLRNYHVVGIGVETIAEANAPAAFVEAIHRDGGVAILAHPAWSGLAGADLLAAPGADATEVWNEGCELEVARGDSSVQWDAALANGAALGGIAADDSHYPGFDSARSWVALRLPELSATAILAALRDRCYYASTGPVLHAVEAEGDRVQVACSPVRKVHLVGPPPLGAGLNAGVMGLTHRATRLRQGDGWAEGSRGENGLTGGIFNLPAFCGWFRVVIEDFQGHRAWSNPLWRSGDSWNASPSLP